MDARDREVLRRARLHHRRINIGPVPEWLRDLARLDLTPEGWADAREHRRKHARERAGRRSA